MSGRCLVEFVAWCSLTYVGQKNGDFHKSRDGGKEQLSSHTHLDNRKHEHLLISHTTYLSSLHRAVELLWVNIPFLRSVIGLGYIREQKHT